jgi:hypothetical protein
LAVNGDRIPKREFDYYSSRLLSIGTDLVVEPPPQLAEAVRAKAWNVAELNG